MMGQTKMYAYGAIGIAILGMFLSFVGGKGIFGLIGGLLSGLGAMFAILILKYGYLIIPILTKMFNKTAYVTGEYEIPATEDVIVRKIGNEYCASVFLALKIYESTTAKSLEETIAYNEYFERAISNMRYVTKISYLLYVEDVSKKIRDLETKRAEAQLRLSREKEKPEPDVLKIDRYEREVGMMQNEIDKIVKGEKPMGVLAYAMTTAKGVSKEAAIAQAKAQGRELRTALAQALTVEVEILTADEMLKCFEWERFFPSSVSEVEDSVV